MFGQIAMQCIKNDPSMVIQKIKLRPCHETGEHQTSMKYAPVKFDLPGGYKM